MEPGERFQVKGALGQGAMGRVVLALDRELGRDVALKLVPLTRGEVGLERFRREGEMAARLEHPGIVRVHSAGQWREHAFLAYELVEGARSLEEAFRGAPRERRVAWVLETAQALAHAHARGVIHRDVKPGNVLVDEAGRARVTDFGLARAGDLTPLTRTGVLLGTPCWMAPEGFQGRRLDARADVWALGVLLYQALVERLPFEGDTLHELSAQVTSERVVPPRELDPGVPGPLEAVCLLALERDPARRPPDAVAFAALLAAALEGRSPVAPPRVAGLALRGLIGLAGALLLGVLFAWARGLGGPALAQAAASPPASGGSSAPAPAQRRPGWALAPGERAAGLLRLSGTRQPDDEGAIATRYQLELRLVEEVLAVEPALERRCLLSRLRLELEDRAATLIDSDDPEAGAPLRPLVGRTFLLRQDPRSGDVLECGLGALCEAQLASFPDRDAKPLRKAFDPLRESQLRSHLSLLWGGLPRELPADDRPWTAPRQVRAWLDTTLELPVEHTLRGEELLGRAVAGRPAPGRRELHDPHLSLRATWRAGRVVRAQVELQARERSPHGTARVELQLSWEQEP